jgi:phosphoribosylglycinamide formyltransferase-1
VDVHGASVHFVTAELDGGPVIAQARVPVEAGDDAAALAERVLRREHPLLVATLRELAAGRVALVDSHVHFDGHALAAPLQLDAGNRLTQESAA